MTRHPVLLAVALIATLAACTPPASDPAPVPALVAQACITNPNNPPPVASCPKGTEP
jgi:hypothetical protein